MTHGQAEALYGAYDQGSLTREQVKDFHAHLKGCEACQSRMRLRATWTKAQRALPSEGLASPEIQKGIARNRDLLVKILLLLVAAWAVSRLRR